MKINGLIKKARWESIPCECGGSDIDSFPIKDCLHCKFDECWQSVPKKDFIINELNLKTNKVSERKIKEITLVRGNRFQDVVGWTW
jgi:hypothetical protein